VRRKHRIQLILVCSSSRPSHVSLKVAWGWARLDLVAPSKQRSEKTLRKMYFSAPSGPSNRTPSEKRPQPPSCPSSSLLSQPSLQPCPTSSNQERRLSLSEGESSMLLSNPLLALRPEPSSAKATGKRNDLARLPLLFPLFPSSLLHPRALSDTTPRLIYSGTTKLTPPS